MPLAGAKHAADDLMLSYLHGYHAGNHADVLKHACSPRCSLGSRRRTSRCASSTRTPAPAATICARPPRKKTANTSAASASSGTRAIRRRRSRAGSSSSRHYNDGAQKLVRYPGSPWLARDKPAARATASFFSRCTRPSTARSTRSSARDRRVTVLRHDGLEGMHRPRAAARAARARADRSDLRDEATSTAT